MLDASKYEAVFRGIGGEYTLPLIAWHGGEETSVMGICLTAEGRVDWAQAMPGFVRYQPRRGAQEHCIPASAGWWAVHRPSERWRRILAFLWEEEWDMRVLLAPEADLDEGPVILDREWDLVYDPSRLEDR